MKHLLSLCLLIACLVGIQAAEDEAILRIATVFSDHAVLQRDKPLPVWGWGKSSAAVNVKLGDQEQTTTVNEDGRWRVTFEARPASTTPTTITVSSGDENLTVSDLLVGEVWLCSGQSNMEWSLNWGVANAKAEMANANYPNLRLLHVARSSTAEARSDIAATWRPCTSESIVNFTAVGYLFGRELHQQLDVPVGLIQSAWGGTPAQSWTSYKKLASDPELEGYARHFDRIMADYPAAMERWEARNTELREGKQVDDTGWEKPALALDEWKDMELPSNWEKRGLDIDGVVWFRHTVEITEEAAGKPLKLSLGPIDDEDITWWDGVEIGRMNAWDKPRVYTVPANLVTAGTHEVAIKVTDGGYGGGLHGKPEQMVVTPGAGDAISLAGVWKYRVAQEKVPEPRKPMGPGSGHLPSGLRNGMITPLIPYAIRGAIWYQGESNAGQAWNYRTLFPAMILDWRADWQDDFPFHFVQLANYTKVVEEPGESDWAELRDAQLHTLKTVPDTGMAVIIDIGDANNIHPANKQDVGKRLALWALAKQYEQDIVYSGPLYREATVEGAAIRVSFDHIGGGLVAKGGALKRFAIAGADKVWHWADAVIDGDTVVVSAAAVSEPVAVRYAWANNPDGCNLYNAEGLPASPFRTDDWPYTTDRRSK